MKAGGGGGGGIGCEIFAPEISSSVPLPVLSASLINFVPRYLSVSTRATVGKNRVPLIFFLTMKPIMEKLGH